jgi:hypothetical protein
LKPLVRQASSTTGVQLPSSLGPAPSATETLRRVVNQTAEQFPHVFSELRGSAGSQSNTRDVSELIAKFELIRAASDQRRDIAIFVTGLIQRLFLYRTERSVQSLDDFFRQPASPLPVAIEEFRATAKAPAMRIIHRSREYSNRKDIIDLFARFLADGLITPEANQALQWSYDRASDPDWADNNIRGRKFALLGGIAELSPISYLLSAGADVLTTHSSDEALHQWLKSESEAAGFNGRLFSIRGGVNLLISPDSIAETIVREFSAGRRVNLAILAYKGGEGREWRLGAAMDGIARKIGQAADLLDSVTYYLSPSVVTQISEETAALSSAKRDREYTLLMKAANLFTGDTLLRPNVLRRGNVLLSNSILSPQGASYLAANLFHKIYAAEAWCSDHSDSGSAIRVSANVAPITRTASTNVRRAQVLIDQAGQFDIEVFDPSTTRTLMYLLMLHDLFSDTPPCNSLFARQVHGGVFTSPWALQSVAKLAYLRAQIGRRRA